MPIRPEDRDRYPADWRQIRRGILDRANNRCECTGECGADHDQRLSEAPNRCAVPDGVRIRWWPPADEDEAGYARGLAWTYETDHVPGPGIPRKVVRIVLTIAHLDHTPETRDPALLRAMCQRCHLAYDRDHHAQRAAQTRRARARERTLDLFPEGSR